MNHSWKFYNDGGYLGTLQFLANGKIGGYSNPNENSWKMNADQMLEVSDAAGKVTARYVIAFQDHYGKYRLMGKFLGTGALPGWTHYLE
jgi:hypothetical protein